MKTIRIFCQLPFLFEIENQNYFVDEYNFLQINSQNPVFVKCYPICQNKYSLPFCFLLEQKIDKVTCNCSNIKVYNLKDRSDVFVEQFKIYSSNILYMESFIVKNTKCTITCFDDRIKLNTSNCEYIFETLIDTVNVDTRFGFVNILTTFDSKKTYTRFDLTTKSFCSVSGDKIQIFDDKILTQNYCNDIFCHTKVCEYKNNNCLDLQTTDLYTNEIIETKQINPNLLPFAFFENIQVEDYQNSENLLCNNLKPLLNKESLFQFFGDIKTISLYSLNPLVYTIYTDKKATDFKIILNENLIQEIEDL